MSPVIVFYGIGACLALFNVLFSIERRVADFSNALLVQPEYRPGNLKQYSIKNQQAG